MAKDIIVSLKGISKSFPGVCALSDVSIDFKAGEVHVLFGENGAGKSTLIKIISGVYSRDCGVMLMGEKEATFAFPREALFAGISVIHQELSLIPDLTVAENIFLGREIRYPKSKIIDKKLMFSKADEILYSLNIPISSKKYIRDISMAERQMVEITKAVSQNARLVIMDEPTSCLSEREVGTLFEIIGTLKKKGVCVIYISHRIHEIRKIGDRISVLRDGHMIKTLNVADSTEDEWVSLMIGREIKEYISRENVKLGDAVLEVEGLTKCPYFQNVSFSLRKGEILGIAGLIGAGRTEILKTVFGYYCADQGRIKINGRQTTIRQTKTAIKNAIGLVPEDRRHEGLMLEKNLVHNIALPSLFKRNRKGFVDTRWEKVVSRQYVDKLYIKTPSISALTKNLSGGNQQKVVIAKWLALDTKILLLDEPTRGIDVNAKAEIYKLMNEFTREGGSIIMVSSELPEVLGVCDRVLVMREGSVSAVLNRDEASEENVIRFASLS